jgi:anti-sigma regulatory factor (Ser/Thr protein kinase)
MRPRSQKIRQALLESVFWRSLSPVNRVALQFNLTRQAVQQHLKRLVNAGQIAARGTGRWRRYSLVRLDEQTREYPLESRLTEEHVWKWVRELVPSHASSEGQELLAYGVSEMVNNAIDHSEGKKVVAHFWRTPVSVTVRIADDGIGIFQKISNRLHLTDPRQSLLELGKGKFTTDPQRHTGEGVFFTSRAFDRFSLRSSDLLFTRSALSEDWLVEI